MKDLDQYNEDNWHPLDGGDAPRYIPSSWTPEFVAERFIEAFEVLVMTPMRIYPTGHSNCWPQYMHEFSDLVEIDATKSVNLTASKIMAEKGRFTAAEIAKSDEVFYWPIKYLSSDLTGSKLLLLWAYCKASDRSFSRIMSRKGWSPTTVKRHKLRALKHLSNCLNRDRVPIR